jgi:hypothetical protein
MEVFKFKQLENGDILLEKVEIDESIYTIIYMDNGNKLLQKYISISSIKEVNRYDLKKSIILSCKVNNKDVPKLKYRYVLDYILKLIDDGIIIIKNSFLNIKTIEKEDHGYYYIKELGISIQGVDSNKSILEIMNQCEKNNISLKMKIKLLNNEIIHISI